MIFLPFPSVFCAITIHCLEVYLEVAGGVFHGVELLHIASSAPRWYLLKYLVFSTSAGGWVLLLYLCACFYLLAFVSSVLPPTLAF
jgi:hypothetical protein